MYKVYVRFFEDGGYIGSEPYDLHIDENTKEDDVMGALMDELREVLTKEYEGSRAWETMSWEINDFEKL